MAYSLPAASSSAISHSPTDNEVESNRPSTSAAAQTSSIYCCQIFINHRGPDVKKTLASLLHRRLTSEGFTVFLDQPELRRGENITSQIESAIRTAYVHVAIFSPRYAESKWCLEELVLMRESRGVIIPVFYNVKPSELKCANGLYAEALRQLENKKTSEEKPRYDPATIDKWRNALVHVAEISGFELEACDGDEGKLLEKVVKGVKMVMVNKTSFEVAKYTGVDENVKDFENTVLLQEQQSGKPQVVGLVGWGGVGKTTLAKELFNRKRSHYTRSCLLSKVKENKNEDSLNSLKKKLFQNLTGSHGTFNIDEDIKSLENHPKFKAFVILDDVDDVKQVYAVLAFDTVLSSDSLILITSKDRGVLPRSRENLSIYTVPVLNPLHSRELFCSHAFSQPHPNRGFESLVEEFLKVCDGLPLNLKVFGSLLREKHEESFWKEQLDRLQKIPPPEIQETFRISYNGLEIDEKEMFLDIANFFIGEKREMAIRIWDGSGWKGSLGFQNLENKFFVEVDSEDEIKMRDHIRDMGRKIVVDEKLPRRFWHWTENSDDMLHQLSNEQVITKVPRRTGVRTARDHESWYKRSRIGLLGKPHMNGVPNTNLQLLDVEEGYLERILKRLQSPEDLIWLRWRNCSRSSLPSWLPMKKLRVLQVFSSDLKILWEENSPAPLELRELIINSPLSKLPESITQLKHLELIILNCASGNLKTLPDKFYDLQSLKRFELTNCSEIKSLPDSFGRLTKLEHIDLSGSKNLERLPDLFRDLIRLKYLDLSHCCNLTISSETFENISTLEYINLSYCDKVEVLPLQIAHQRSLQKLYFRFLEMVPSPLNGNLKGLKLCNYKELRCLPISGEQLDQLTKLTVNECVFSELPFESKGGTETSRLQQSGRERTLSNLGSSIDKSKSKLLQLRHLELYRTKISEVSFAEGFAPNLQHLLIRSCNHLVKVGTLPDALTKLELTSCSKLKKIEGLCGLAKLQMLNIKWCTEVEELSSIETLVSLEVLDVYDCRNLMRIQSLAQSTKLRRLEIVKCSELQELPGVEHLMSLNLMSLKRLNASECPKLQSAKGVLERLHQQVQSRQGTKSKDAAVS